LIFNILDDGLLFGNTKTIIENNENQSKILGALRQIKGIVEDITLMKSALIQFFHYVRNCILVFALYINE